jgi:predicted peptidase
MLNTYKYTQEVLNFQSKEKPSFSLQYILAKPVDLQEGEVLPLVVFLHGAGERGNDNEKQFFHCVQYLADHMPETIIVAPQCPEGQQWVDTPWSLGAYSIEEVPESDEMIAVMELLDELKEKYSVDTDRIYAAGISMGGFGTWDIMMRHNDVFAAGIPVCGGGDPSQAENLVDVPLFVFHGDKDDAVPVSGSRDTVQAIKDAGGTKVEYVEYAGAGHGIWNNAFATEGLLEKLLQQRLSDRIPVEESSEEPSEDVSDTSASSDSGNGGFLNYAHFVPIIAAVVISVGLVIYTIIKYKK